MDAVTAHIAAAYPNLEQGLGRFESKPLKNDFLPPERIHNYGCCWARWDLCW